MNNTCKGLHALLPIFIVFCITFQGIDVYAQEQPDDDNDALEFSALNKSPLSFLLDDVFVYAGVGTGGIYYSNYFRDMSYRPAALAGIEVYLPLGGITNFTGGVSVVSRNFEYAPQEGSLRVSSMYIDFPLMTSFELPILKEYDFRLILGTNVSFRIGSSISGDQQEILASSDAFHFRPEDFHRWDFGWIFGFGIEYDNFIARMRSYSGFRKFDRKDQGMYNSFQLEFGYFLFRKLNIK